MIVSPDFPDHWKTRMLVDILKDEAAPVYVIRIWAHCQNRKNSVFTMIPSAGLKALCRYPGDAIEFENAFIASGFLIRDGENLIVHQWDDYNASLIANWENGKKGGRKPKQNPNETHGLPMANPIETHSQPMENPTRTDKIREDKIREEKKTITAMQPFTVDDQVWNDFIALRKAKRAPLTETALASIEKESEKAGLTLNAALTECVTRGWQSFKSDWVKPKQQVEMTYQRAC